MQLDRGVVGVDEAAYLTPLSPVSIFLATGLDEKRWARP